MEKHFVHCDASECFTGTSWSPEVFVDFHMAVCTVHVGVVLLQMVVENPFRCSIITHYSISHYIYGSILIYGQTKWTYSWSAHAQCRCVT